MAGSLRQRSAETWELRVSTGKDPLTGRYRIASRTFRGNKTEARRELSAFVREVEQGKHVGTSATLATLLERWLDKIEGDRSPRTMDGYRMNVRVHILPALGHVPLNKLEPETLDSFYAGLKRGNGRAPLSVATTRQVHAIVRAALNQAVRWRWIPQNPALLADPGKLRPVEHHPPAPDAVLRLIEAADPDVAVFLRVAAATGARRGEVCALRWEHVDLTTGVVRIERSIIQTGKGGKELVEKATKTNQRRKVRLDPDTVEVLRQHRMRWVERTRRTLNLTLSPSAFLFSTAADASTPMRPDGATQAVARLRDKLGMPGLRLHDLRHFVATQLLADGVPVKAVADRLGHADVATTLRVYAHALEAADVEAAASMGRILSLNAKNPQPEG